MGRGGVAHRAHAGNRSNVIYSPVSCAQRERRSVVQEKNREAFDAFARIFLTFAIENSLVVTLVSRLAKFDRHFFLDFIFL